MDTFTKARLLRFLDTFKTTHGHDASMADLVKANFSEETIKNGTRDGLIEKYQVAASSGATENRFKLLVDWRSLKL